MLRDPVAADDVVQTTFVNAWKHLRKRRVEGNIRAWLMSIARNGAIDAVRSRKRLERLGTAPIETLEYAGLADDPRADPEEMAQRGEVATLVWEAASSLTPAEYALLDLHLRHGLDADDLARHLGTGKNSVHVRLFRLRDSLRKSVIAALVWRHPGGCAFVESLKHDAAGGAMTHAHRQVLLRHVDICEICRATTERFANPAQIFAGLIIIPAPEAARPAIWDAILAALPAASAGAGAGAAGGAAFAGKIGDAFGWIGRTLRSPAFGGAAAAAAVIAIVAAVVAGGGGDSEQPPAAASDAAVASASTADDVTPRGSVLAATRVPPDTPTPATGVVIAPRPAARPRPATVPPLFGAPQEPVPPAVAPTSTPAPRPGATRAPSSAGAAPRERTSTPTPSPTFTALASPSSTPTATGTPTPTATATQPAASCGGLDPTIVGTSGSDVLNGTHGVDVIDGLGGDDILHGHGGDDVICGGAGDDQLDGGHGADALYGDAGDDALSGHHDDDALDGGVGSDRCDGGTGNDTAAACEVTFAMP